MPDYDFRILIETEGGKTFSYGTASYVSTDNTSVVLTTREGVDRINNMPSMSFFNGPFNLSTNLYTNSHSSATFASTSFEAGPAPLQFPNGHQFLSCSITGSESSGSIGFDIKTVLSSGTSDRLKRYKFFGNKVCNVLGVPENYWIYSDRFRLTNSGSEQIYMSGDILAQSVHIKNNLAISNAGSIETDLPLHHFKNTDRWVKWTDVSGSVPVNDMMIGYSNLNDRYEIRMKNEDLFISASAVTASNDIRIGGEADIRGNLKLNNTTITATGTELNKMDGGTPASPITPVDADRVVYNDNGTMRQVSIQTLAGYFDDEITSMPNLTSVGTLTGLTVDDITLNASTIADAGSLFLDAGGDISLTADGGDIFFKSGSSTRFTFNLDTAPSIDVTGNFEIDSSGDITLDAAGDDIFFNDNGTPRFGFNLDSTPQIDVFGDLYINPTLGDTYFDSNVNVTGSIEVATGSSNNLTPALRLNKLVDDDGSDGGTATGILMGAVAAGQAKTGIFSENAGAGNGRQNLIFAMDSTADTSDADLSDERMRITYEGNVGIGTTTPSQKLEVSGQISSSGAIRINNHSTSAYAVEAGIKWMVFTGTLGNTNSTRQVTHGISNGKKRIVSINVQVEVESGESTPVDVPDNSFLAGGANFQDGTNDNIEYQTWYDDSKIYIHVESSAVSIDNNRFTMLVHYTNTDLY